MGTRVLLTVDTELTWRHFKPGADWHDNFALSCDPAGVGISYQLAQFARNGLKACFFVDPMPALVYGIDPIRRMIEPILDAGQEVQLHLHSFWYDLANGRGDRARFELTQFDAAEQRALIARARDLLVEAGAPEPTGFRSGSFAANSDTFSALCDLGLAYDSSHNGIDHPWPSALPLDAEQIDPCKASGLTELPVTQIRQRNGGLRPFQICALSTGEMEAALRHAASHDHPLVTIVGHSFELASRDGKRVNELVRRRFDRLCRFLDDQRAEMPTIRLAAVPAPAGAAGSSLLPAGSLRTIHRLAEQAWGNVRYERPALAAALLAPPPIVALSYLAYAGL